MHRARSIFALVVSLTIMVSCSPQKSVSPQDNGAIFTQAFETALADLLTDTPQPAIHLTNTPSGTVPAPALSSSSDDCIPSVNGITYIVSDSSMGGTVVNRVHIKWKDENGVMIEDEYTLPFCKQFKNPSMREFYIFAVIASSTDETGSIICQVYKNDYVISEDNAKGYASSNSGYETKAICSAVLLP